MSTPITQILLLRDPEVAGDVGRALWAVLDEVADFYDRGEFDLDFRRFWMGIGSAELSVPGDATRLEPPEWIWERSKGRFARTWDHTRIVATVHDVVLNAVGDPGRLLIVTDLELTPPPEWRYVIWYGDHGGEAVGEAPLSPMSSYGIASMAPLDPRYWRSEEENRVAVIKHRVRAACMSIVGGFAGLGRCRNPSCFLFHQVDSVTTLDQMVYLGEEHAVEPLRKRGYHVLSEDPDREQEIMEDPEPLEDFFA